MRILEVVNVMDRAGLETMLMNHYRNIDRKLIQFDFLTHRPKDGDYDDEIRAMGGQLFQAPRLYPQNALSYTRYMRDFFSSHHYPVVHAHIDAMSYFPLSMAKKCGVPVRIAHSHSDSIDADIRYPIKQIARKKLPKAATHYWACSKNAGAFLFGEGNAEKVHVVKNAIELDHFRYNSKQRLAKRTELNISNDQLVIGHVGRFSSVKNHAFLIEVFEEIIKSGNDAILVLVGDGELRHSIEQKVDSKGFSSKVRFLGLRRDIEDLLQAFDLLLFPSLHEGIPLTLIEAQASGLPILTSDSVSSEALILPNSISLSLSDSLEQWASKAVMLSHQSRADNAIEKLSDSGYEIRLSASKLAESYQILFESAVGK